MISLSLALDWTPNTNHIGFFVARELGFYQSNGIELHIMDPSEDDYAITPAKKMELNQADFALCPTESIISYKTKKNPLNLIGVAAIFKNDLSAIAVKESSRIISPRDLDGHSYASYNAKYEDKIVKQMIINDGGRGDIAVSYPKKLNIWNTIVNNTFDSTWIFVNWEGIEAKTTGVNLTLFKMSDFNIPYSYSPLIVANAENVEKKYQDYKKFLTSTKEGFLFAKNNQDESIKILEKYVPQLNNINLQDSLSMSAEYLGNEHDWGVMNHSVVDEFLSWLHENHLESKKFEVSEIITNELLSS